MDARMQRRVLTTAFLAIPRHLSSRPEPRHVFDNVGCNGRVAPRGADLIETCQVAMRAAIATGDAATIELTQVEIIAYYDVCLSQALCESPLIDGVAMPEAAVAAAKETAEALAAIADAGTTRTPAAIERATKESGEAIVSLELFRQSARGIPSRRALQVIK